MFNADHFPLWYKRAAEQVPGTFVYSLPFNIGWLCLFSKGFVVTHWFQFLSHNPNLDETIEENQISDNLSRHYYEQTVKYSHPYIKLHTHLC